MSRPVPGSLPSISSWCGRCFVVSGGRAASTHPPPKHLGLWGKWSLGAGVLEGSGRALGLKGQLRVPRVSWCTHRASAERQVCWNFLPQVA